MQIWKRVLKIQSSDKVENIRKFRKKEKKKVT